MDDLVAKALHAARQHFDEGGFLESLRGMFSGPDYLSTGEVASPTNWGDPEVASDFFKADRALRLAREVQASEPARDMPLRRPAPEAAPRQQIVAAPPAPAPAPALVQAFRPVTTLPIGDVEPHDFPPITTPSLAFGEPVYGEKTQRLGGGEDQNKAPAVQMDYTIGNAGALWPSSGNDIQTYAGIVPEDFNEGIGNPMSVDDVRQSMMFRPEPRAEVARAVSLARNLAPAQPEAIPSAADALAAVEKFQNAGIFSGNEYDKAGEILAAHNRAMFDSIPVEEALRLNRAAGPMMINQGMPREERPTVRPIAYSPEAPAAPAAAAINQATGKLTARAPQGPDLNDRQRDLIIRTIAAETSGKSPEESQAIAHVILNRIQSGKYGATPEAVLFARKQFEPWSNPNGANYPMRFTPESRRYGLGQTALDAALGAEDITKGATNFWAPKAQAAMGRRPPKWGRTGGVDIGETRFHNLSRAEGGLVDDALHVVREHHADGKAVGRAPEMPETPTPEDAAVTIARRQPVTPASLARAWTPPEEAFGPEASKFVQTYPEKLGEALYNAPGAIAHSIKDPFDLANQAYQGQLPPNYFQTDEGMGRAFNASMMPVTGGFALSHAVGPAVQSGETMLGMAVKPKGGNWIKGSVEAETEGLKNRDLARALQEPADLPAANIAVDDPINNWIDKKLNKYIKNEMGTPEDPIRPLAERDILHIKPELMFPTYKDRPGQTRLAQSNTARAWEDVSDRSIVGGPAKNYFDYDQGIPWAGAQEVYEKNPWLEKVLPETTVYEANASRQITNDLGFDHLVDELKNTVRPDSDLPTHLRMTPDKLDKVSMPQAVELVSKINKWREEAAANALAVNANNEATHLVKEYPDKGYKWVELKPPTTVSEEVLQSLNPFEKNLYQRYLEAGDTPYNALQGVIGDQAKVSPALKAALKYEGDMMGHCVGGYCDNVAAGESRIFSLRDSKGRPHVTIETEPSRHLAGFGNAINKIEPGLWEKMVNEGGHINSYKWLQENRPDIYNKMKAENIVQVKGKGNLAPKDEYLPFVQDFIKSKDWNVIEDLHNTGLYEVKPGQRLPGFAKEIEPGLYSMEDFQKMAVENEMPQEIMDQWMTKLRNPRDYASGGAVKDASCGCEKPTDGGSVVDRALMLVSQQA